MSAGNSVGTAPVIQDLTSGCSAQEGKASRRSQVMDVYAQVVKSILPMIYQEITFVLEWLNNPELEMPKV